jgi:hypothetical protein
LDSGSSRFLEVAKEEQPPSFMDPWKQYWYHPGCLIKQD